MRPICFIFKKIYINGGSSRLLADDFEAAPNPRYKDITVRDKPKYIRKITSF